LDLGLGLGLGLVQLYFSVHVAKGHNELWVLLVAATNGVPFLPYPHACHTIRHKIRHTIRHDTSHRTPSFRAHTPAKSEHATSPCAIACTRQRVHATNGVPSHGRSATKAGAAGLVAWSHVCVRQRLHKGNAKRAIWYQRPTEPATGGVRMRSCWQCQTGRRFGYRACHCSNPIVARGVVWPSQRDHLRCCHCGRHWRRCHLQG
jgi:hypothetical protein